MARSAHMSNACWMLHSANDVHKTLQLNKGNVADLKATIEKEAANIAVQDSAIEDLAGQIAIDEADLKAAAEIREKEAVAFSAEEKDLVETIDALERAIGIMEKEMNGGTALASRRPPPSLRLWMSWSRHRAPQLQMARN